MECILHYHAIHAARAEFILFGRFRNNGAVIVCRKQQPCITAVNRLINRNALEFCIGISACRYIDDKLFFIRIGIKSDCRLVQRNINRQFFRKTEMVDRTDNVFPAFRNLVSLTNGKNFTTAVLKLNIEHGIFVNSIGNGDMYFIFQVEHLSNIGF